MKIFLNLNSLRAGHRTKSGLLSWTALGGDPSSAMQQLCDLGQGLQVLRAPVSLSQMTVRTTKIADIYLVLCVPSTILIHSMQDLP